MRYIEYIEQHDYDSGIREVATLDEAEDFIISCYENEERTNRYVDEFGSRPHEDLYRAQDSGDEDYRIDIIKRLFEFAGFYVNVKEEPANPELDQF